MNEGAKAVTDPLPEIKEKLLRLFDSMLEESWTTEIRANLKLFLRLNSTKQKQQLKSFTERIAVQLREFMERVPEELKEGLAQLQPLPLAELMMTDWLDRAAEERRAAMMELANGETYLSDRIHLAVSDVWMVVELCIDDWDRQPELTAEDLPPHLAHIFEKEEEKEVEEQEFDPTAEVEDDGEMEISECQKRQHLKFDFGDELGKLLPIPSQGTAVARRLVEQCAPHTKWLATPLWTDEEREKFAEIIQSFELTEAMKAFASQQQLLSSPIHEEMRAMMIEYLELLQRIYEEETETLRSIRGLAVPHRVLGETIANLWIMGSMRFKSDIMDEAARRQLETPPMANSPTALGARLILVAATDKSCTFEALVERVSNITVRRAFENTEHYATTLHPFLIEWAEKEVVVTLQKGQKEMANLFGLPEIQQND